MAAVIKGELRRGSASMRKSGSNVIVSEIWDYIVIAEKTDTRYDVLTAPGLPTVNYTTLAQSGAVCVGKDADRDEQQPRKWIVSCTFETSSQDQDPDESSETPLDPQTWFPRWGGTCSSFDFYGNTDADGKAVLNSMKQRFNEGTALRKSLVAFQFSQYEANTLTVKQIADRNDKVNSNTIKGFPAKTLLLVVRGFEYGWFYGYDCLRIDYGLTYNPDTWIQKRLDIGEMYLDDEGKKTPALQGGYLTEVRLNGEGGKLEDDAEDEFIDVKVYKELNFNFLRAQSS